MLEVTVSNLEGINLPARIGDVGYDLIASTDPIIVGTKTDELSVYYSSIDYIEYEVDLKIAPPEGVWSMVFPRSSISTKNLSMCNSVAVIDNGYRGKIKVRFNYAIQPEDLLIFSTELSPLATEVNYEKIYKKGDKIAQLVFANSILPSLSVGDLSETQRGEGGFGSTNP